MTAEFLRETARMMRETAKAARAGRWYADESAVFATWRHGPQHVATCAGSLEEGNRANARHMAAWDPGVAVTVADWLDDLARLSEYGDTGGPRLWGHAIAVARAWRADQ